MRTLALLVLAAVSGLSGAALAGPNAGGTLVVHDPGLAYTSDGSSFPSPAPTVDPPTVDNQLPVGIPPDAEGWVWKVYAAFPAGYGPRLKAMAMGEEFGPDVTVLAGGLPSALDFEIAQDGWPTTSGGGVGISFYPLRTDPVVECYWFAGYGSLGGIWAVAPHPTQIMIFVDDSNPPQEDPIAGLSTIGFGVDGETAYPPAVGACCQADGSCVFTHESDCTTGDWRQDVLCDPNPCPPAGACCHSDGSCTFTLEADCGTGDWRPGEGCDPNPCPEPPDGACCYWDGTCQFLPEHQCESGLWLEQPCAPNPCPQLPTGACCHPHGECTVTHEHQCWTGLWLVDQACEPNPCPQPPTGACCDPHGECTVTHEHDCWHGPWFAGQTCEPNPCPQPTFGACCDPHGGCAVMHEHDCWMGVWLENQECEPNPCPQPPLGACCDPDGGCLALIEIDCHTGDWREGVSCEPNPCPVLPHGACCYADGHCVYIHQAGCSENWLEGVSCEPNPCPQPPPTGACCFGQDCHLTTESSCTGQWQGAGTDCSPNPCCRGTVPPPSGTKDPRTLSSVGAGHGKLASGPRVNPCPGSALVHNFDGSAENGYAWGYGGVMPPDFGSFAEGYDLETHICGVQLALTQVGYESGQPIDVYVWEMDWECGIPGAVLSLATPVVVSGVAYWPSYSLHDVDTPDVFAQSCFVGYWPRGWVGQGQAFYCVADLDGFGGLPRTNIAPGIGYPTGWQDPSIVWGPTQALGLGAYVAVAPVPTVPTTWGKIKAMYH